MQRPGSEKSMGLAENDYSTLIFQSLKNGVGINWEVGKS